MIYSVFTFINIFIAIVFLVFLGFLYTKIKNESGKWTALLVVLIGLAFVKCDGPNLTIDNNKKEYVLYDCPAIKSNRHLEIENKIGSLITICHYLEIYVPKDKSDQNIRIVSQNSVMNGLSSGFKFEVSNIQLEQTTDNKIRYRIGIKTSMRLFGILNYCDLQTFVGEK